MSAPDHQPGDSSPPQKWSAKRFLTDRFLEILVVVLVLSGLYLLLRPFMRSIWQAAEFGPTSNRLREIGLACHNYDAAEGELPANSYAANGTPLLSWRFHLLPHIGEDDLYRQFKLDEPWDSPDNIRLLDRMPDMYRHPDERGNRRTTHYRGFTQPGAVFERRPPRSMSGAILGGPLVDVKTRHSLANFEDPLAETILVVETEEAVEWTRPDELDATPGKPFPVLAVHGNPPLVLVLMADGSTRRFKPTLPETMRRSLTTHSGGEKLPHDWHE